MAELQDEGDHSDDTLQEKVEEQNGGCTTYESVKDEEYLSFNGGRCCHSKPYDSESKNDCKSNSHLQNILKSQLLVADTMHY